jgi:hypothetical protein
MTLCSLRLPFLLQVNGEKIGKGLTKIIRDGNEIAFGTPLPQPQNDGVEDYRELNSPRYSRSTTLTNPLP